MERIMEEEGVKWLIVMTVDAPLGGSIERSMHSPRRVLSPTSTSSQSCASRTTRPTTMPSVRHSSPSIRL